MDNNIHPGIAVILQESPPVTCISDSFVHLLLGSEGVLVQPCFSVSDMDTFGKI